VSAVDYVIGTYSRSSQLAECIDALLAAGGESELDNPAVMALLRNRLDELAGMLDLEPDLMRWQFDELEFGTSGARTLTLRGATLLHVAAEYGNVDAVRMLLERGADVNIRAKVDENGVGGQTAIFHAVTQFWSFGAPVVQALLERDADLSIRVKLPGHYERAGEVVECTPLGYAELFPGGHMGMENKCIAMLKERGATE
jgi:hypothetical protein